MNIFCPIKDLDVKYRKCKTRDYLFRHYSVQFADLQWKRRKLIIAFGKYLAHRHPGISFETTDELGPRERLGR